MSEQMPYSKLLDDVSIAIEELDEQTIEHERNSQEQLNTAESEGRALSEEVLSKKEEVLGRLAEIVSDPSIANLTKAVENIRKLMAAGYSIEQIQASFAEDKNSDITIGFGKKEVTQDTDLNLPVDITNQIDNDDFTRFVGVDNVEVQKIVVSNDTGKAIEIVDTSLTMRHGNAGGNYYYETLTPCKISEPILHVKGEISVQARIDGTLEVSDSNGSSVNLGSGNEAQALTDKLPSCTFARVM